MRKLLYFSAAWCMPCKMFGPVMDEVSEQYPVEKIDVDGNVEMSNLYKIKNVPSVLLVESDGTEVKRFIGVKSKQQILDFYNEQ